MSVWTSRPIELLSLPPLAFQRHVAVHESGHAVVGLAQGLTVLRIQIGSDIYVEGGWAAGGTVFDAPAGDQKQLAKERPKEMAVALLAGVAAEQLLLGAYGIDGWSEDLRILRVGLGWVDSVVDERRREELAAFVGASRVSVAELSDEIRRLADALIDAKSLDRYQIADVLQSV